MNIDEIINLSVEPHNQENEKDHTFTAPELDKYMTMFGYRHMGNHWEYRVYGKEHDRMAYKREVKISGIVYNFHKRYIGEEYIRPVPSLLSRK